MLNDEELRQLTGKPNLISAAREILGWGPSMVVAKQGEYGSALITADDFFALPAYPLHEVVDPTGAGDTLRRRLRRLHRQPDRRRGDHARCCATPWPTAPRSRRSTSSASGPRASRRSTRRRVRARVDDLYGFAHFEPIDVELKA